MHIVIAGGSGFIGQALVKHFQSQHHKITVISRSPSRLRKIFKEPVESISWESLAELKNVDVLINLAGENLFSGLLTKSKKDKILKSRLATTRALVDWLKKQTNSITFICASGINIYPSNSFIVYSENDSMNIQNLGGFMVSLARRWEEMANQARSAHCRVINLRQAVVLDKSGGMLAKVLPLSRYFSGVVLGEGNQPFLWVSLVDVVRVVDFLIQEKSIQGPVNVVTPDVLTQEQFAAQLAAKFNKPCFIRVPDFFLKLLMGDLAEELILDSPKAEPFVLRSHGFEFKHKNFNMFLQDLNF